MAQTNRTGGKFRLSMLGKNLTTKEVDIYQISITTGEPISFSADPLSSGNYDMITVRGRDGSIIGQVQGDEQDPSGEFNFSFYEDFAHLNANYVYGNSKNLLLNMLNGEAFKNGEDVIVPIGTNGTDKTKTARAKFNEMNKPYKYIYYNEGAFIKENGTADVVNGGKVTLKRNPYESAFNQSYKTFCGEIMTTTGEGQVNRMFAILGKGTLEFAEGDINQYNVTAQRGCDLFERDDFFTEVYAGDSELANTNELYVSAIVLAGGTDPESGVAGDLILSITADGTPSIKKWGSSWTADSSLNSLISTGTRFKSRKVIGASVYTVERNEEIDNTVRTLKVANGDCNVFAVVDDKGKCVDFTTDGTKRFYCKVKDFDLNVSRQYEDYLTVE